jgi:hypothetical protein
MTDASSSRGRPLRAGRWQPVMLAAALTAIAVLAAACNGSAGSNQSLGRSAVQIAIDYAGCMRAHGAPDWPDPDNEGQFVKTLSNRSDFTAPASAYQDCRRVLPGAGKFTVADQQKAAPLRLEFGACMRSHGIANFPDPVVNDKGVYYDPHGLDVSSPRFLAAQAACRKYVQAAGKYVPKVG